MVEPMKKWIDHQYVQIPIKGKAGSEVQFHLVISETRLTDEEDAKLKDILLNAAETASDLLGGE